MPNITKNLFLSTLQCPMFGWQQHHHPVEEPTSPASQLRIDEGIEVQQRARSLFPDGVMVSGDNETCITKTKELLANPQISTIFEATFQTGPYITKADILIRTGSKWKMIEIKSAVNQSDEHIDDMAYTAFVALESGLEISSCSLLLVNKEYRLRMPDENLFVEIDLSAVEHREYLAQADRDCRRELAERLIRDCGSEGSILVYTSFEKTIINGLAELFPDLAEELGQLVGRLVDLYQIIKKSYYHPDFHGSYSIKKVLPVVVPGLGYDDMEIDNGLDASAVFAYMCRGRYDVEEVVRIREQLKLYCCLDTMAMVRLEEGLRGM